MIHKMPGQVGSLKSRKRKSNTEVKSSRKASSARRRCMKSSRMPSAAESSAAGGGCSQADGPLERLSIISCECHGSAGRRRCSASPEHEGREGKENKCRSVLEADGCSMNATFHREEAEDMECEEDAGKDLFPDDDSNQILPVEQFFGNLDVVQDFPQRQSATSSRVQREGRRRHYYAREDSDEEEVDVGSMQRERGGS